MAAGARRGEAGDVRAMCGVTCGQAGGQVTCVWAGVQVGGRRALCGQAGGRAWVRRAGGRCAGSRGRAGEAGAGASTTMTILPVSCCMPCNAYEIDLILN